MSGESAADEWDGVLWVCGECGVPTESEPCPDHQRAGDREVGAIVELWSRDRLAEHKLRRSVRVMWPELAERLDELIDAVDET